MVANSGNGGMIDISQQGYSYQVGPLLQQETERIRSLWTRYARGKSVQKEFINTITRGRKSAKVRTKKGIMLHDTGAGDELRANKEKMEILSMGKYHQSKYEQEVIIGFNAAEGTAEIYTADPVWIRKMDKLVQQNPEQFRPGRVETYQGEIVVKWYTFPKRLISIRSKERRLTDEQRAELAARFNRG